MSAAHTFKPHPDWGNADGFICAGCEKERVEIGGYVRPEGWPKSLGVCVCGGCWQMMTVDKQFRSRVREKSGGIAQRSYIQRVADLLEVAPASFFEAMTAAKLEPGVVDQILGRPQGATYAAMAFVTLGMHA